MQQLRGLLSPRNVLQLYQTVWLHCRYPVKTLIAMELCQWFVGRVKCRKGPLLLYSSIEAKMQFAKVQVI